MTQLPPNWYPDPWNPQQQRYWDGQCWSDQVRSLLTPELIACRHHPLCRRRRETASLVTAAVLASGLFFVPLGIAHR